MRVEKSKGRLSSTSIVPTTYDSIPSVEIEDVHEIESGASARHHFWQGPWKGEPVPYRTFLGVTLILSSILLVWGWFASSLIRSPVDIERSSLYVGLEGLPLSDMHVYQDVVTGVWEVTSTETNPKLGTKLKKYHPRGALALAEYKQSVGDSGWNALSVRSTMPPHLGDDRKWHSRYIPRDEILNDYVVSKLAMGYLEGFVTCPKIQDWYRNFYQGVFDGGNPKVETLDFLETNHDWMIQESARHWKTSEYWLTVRGTMAQLHGMLAGIRAACPGVDEEEDKVHQILPGSGDKMVSDFDGSHEWLGGRSGGEDDDATTSETPTFHRGIYLPSIHRRPSLIHLLLLNANGDLYQIAAKFKQGTAPTYDDDYNGDDDYSKAKRKGNVGQARERRSMRGQAGGPQDSMSRSQWHYADLNRGSTMMKPSHCSALIKILPDHSDIYFGHATWDDYQCAAPRIFKTFEYPLVKDGRPSGWFVTHFSSSPGLLSSIDDFYINRGRTLSAVIETSLDIYDDKLLEAIKPTTNLAWVRAVVGNYLAADGKTWSELFSKHHSGTYVNQWMFLDMSRFSLHDDRPPQEGFFTVLEEMPGLIHWEDMTTKFVNDGFWPSYNNPFFADIAKVSGQDDLCLKDSNKCYETDPRALIFEREQKKVHDLASFKAVMGFNEWESDPLSQNNSCFAIACRNDLQPNVTKILPYGAIDAKVSSLRMAASGGNKQPAELDYDPESFKSVAIPLVYSRLGPTTDEQTPFCWSQFKHTRNARGKTWNHYGHPDCFDFDWQQIPLPFRSERDDPSSTEPMRMKGPPEQRSPSRQG